MGDYADLILDGDVDMYTGEYLGEGGGCPKKSSYERRRKRYKYTIKELQELDNRSLGNLIKGKAKLCRYKLDYYQTIGKRFINIITLHNDVKKLALYRERIKNRALKAKEIEKELKRINKESIPEASEEIFNEAGCGNDDK